MSEEARAKLKAVGAWIGRHITAVAIAVIGIVVIIAALSYKSDNDSKIGKIYDRQQTITDSTRYAARMQFYAATKYYAEPPTYAQLDNEESNAVQKVQSSPEYRLLDDQAKKVKSENDLISLVPFLGLWLIGIALTPLFTGLTLYLMTCVPFTKIMMKGDDDKWCASESMAAMGLAGTIYKTIMHCFTAIIFSYMFVNYFLK